MKILAVCGVGQGSSLILKMNVQQAVDEMGLDAEVENTDVSSAKMEEVDLIVASGFHEGTLKEALSPVVIVKDFMNVEEIKKQIQEFLDQKGG